MDTKGGRLPFVVWSGRSFQSFFSAAALPPHENMMAGPTGKIVAVTLKLHL